jgi:hypothetical protein
VKGFLEALELGMMNTTMENMKRARILLFEEDLQLCKSYFHISQDLVTNSGHKSTTFWLKM